MRRARASPISAHVRPSSRSPDSAASSNPPPSPPHAPAALTHGRLRPPPPAVLADAAPGWLGWAGLSRLGWAGRACGCRWAGSGASGGFEQLVMSTVVRIESCCGSHCIKYRISPPFLEYLAKLNQRSEYEGLKPDKPCAWDTASAEARPFAVPCFLARPKMPAELPAPNAPAPPPPHPLRECGRTGGRARERTHD